MNFNKKIPEWKNVGTEPQEELKKEGFKAGYKPPAAYFNWFFNRISESVKELQETLVSDLKALAFKDKVGNADITDVSADKVTQNTNRRMITDVERTNWSDANSRKHDHGNKTIIDKVTQALLDNWSAAHSHVSDAVKHITTAERTKWNDADTKKHTHDNKSVLDTITQVIVNNWNAAFTHISNKSNPHGVTKSQVGLGSVPNVATNDQTPTYTPANELGNVASGEKLSISFGKIMKAIADFILHKADAAIHISSAERTKWDTVTGKVDKATGKQLSANDYTDVEKTKLAGIAVRAEVNVQADWSVTDTANDAFVKNKPTAMPASDVAAWAKASTKPAYSWTEVGSKPSTFPPATHVHDDKVNTSGGDIADTKVSAYTASTVAYPVPAPGETARVGWGKVKKFFEDMNNLRASMLFIGGIVNNCVTNNASLPLSAAQGKALMDLYTQLNSNKAAISHLHDDRYYTETEANDLLSAYHKKISYGARHGSIVEQVINTTATVIGSNEPEIPFDCFLIASYHITLRSTSSRARVYWMIDGAYIQGDEHWNGSVCQDYAYDKTFIIPATKGQTIQLKMTDTNGVGIVSRANNASLNKFAFLYVPR